MNWDNGVLRFLRVNIRTLLGFAISGILLWRTFDASSLNFKQIELSGSQWLFFTGAILLFALSIGLFSIRTKLLWITDMSQTGRIKAYSSLIIGNFYNCLLPGNLGEGVRVWHFSQKNKVSLVRSLATVVTEKWIDAQLFAVIVLGLFITGPFISHYITYTLLAVAVVVAILCITYQVLTRSKRIDKLIWRTVLSIHRKVGIFFFRLYRACRSNIDHLVKHNLLWRYVGFSLGILSLNLLQFYCLLHAAGVRPELITLFTMLTIASAIMVIAIVPSAPSNIGVMHYGVYSALILLAQQNDVTPTAVDLKTFALFGVYLHLSYFIPEIVMGLAFIVIERKKLF